MNQLRCIAIEDEPQALQLLAHFASQVPFIRWEGGFRQPLEALPLLGQDRVDILFLDIHLHTMDGLSFYRSLPRKPKVIFTTAFAHHAVESYTLEALDYLVKPIVFDRFLQACNKALPLLSAAERPEKHPPREASFYIKSGNRWHQLHWAAVHFLEKDENYLVFHLGDGKKILSRQNMADIEKVVPAHFARIHKSYIINTEKISVIEREKVVVGGVTLSLAESYRAYFLQRLGLDKNQDPHS